MIKKLIIAFSILILIALGIFVGRPMLHKMTREQDILNYLNRKSTRNISEKAIKERDYENEIDTNKEWDITIMVSDYIRKMNALVKAKAKNWSRPYVNKEEMGEHILIQTRTGINLNGLTAHGYEYALRDITHEEVAMYNNGTFNDYLVKKLEEFLIHKSDDMNKEWYVQYEKHFHTELPFGTGFGYVPEKIKKFNYEYSNIEYYYDYEDNYYKQNIDYRIDRTDRDTGVTKRTEVVASFGESGWHKDDMYIMPLGQFYKLDFARAYFGFPDYSHLDIPHTIEGF